MEIHPEKAALESDLAFIKWAKIQAYEYRICEHTIAAAAEGSHLSVVQYLIEQNPDVGLERAYENAAESGHLHVI